MQKSISSIFCAPLKRKYLFNESKERKGERATKKTSIHQSFPKGPQRLDLCWNWEPGTQSSFPLWMAEFGISHHLLPSSVCIRKNLEQMQADLKCKSRHFYQRLEMCQTCPLQALLEISSEMVPEHITVSPAEILFFRTEALRIPFCRTHQRHPWYPSLGCLKFVFKITVASVEIQVQLQKTHFKTARRFLEKLTFKCFLNHITFFFLQKMFYMDSWLC